MTNCCPKLHSTHTHTHILATARLAASHCIVQKRSRVMAKPTYWPIANTLIWGIPPCTYSYMYYHIPLLNITASFLVQPGQPGSRIGFGKGHDTTIATSYRNGMVNVKVRNKDPGVKIEESPSGTKRKVIVLLMTFSFLLSVMPLSELLATISR